MKALLKCLCHLLQVTSYEQRFLQEIVIARVRLFPRPCLQAGQALGLQFLWMHRAFVNTIPGRREKEKRKALLHTAGTGLVQRFEIGQNMKANTTEKEK